MNENRLGGSGIWPNAGTAAKDTQAMMTKTVKAAIFLINMRIKASGFGRQVFLFQKRCVVSGAACWLVLCAALGSCGPRREKAPLIPPATSPLSRTVVGFGVINVSYTQISAEPDEQSVSAGYLRQGSLVRVVERRLVKKGAAAESWVLVEGNSQGWLREALVDIFDNEGRARTASESMNR